jgi:hypothetical protein
MIGDAVRLTFKQVRFEALVIGAAMLVLTLALLAEAWRLQSLDLATCAAPTPPLDCQRRLAEFDGQFMIVMLLEVVAAVLTVFGGLVLGVAVVGREIERGTTSLAWPLARSRQRWLLQRWLVVGAGLVGASLLVGWGVEALSAAMQTAGRSGAFEGIELRAPILAMRTLAAFTLATLAGAVLGRTLPGLLVAVVAMLLLVLGVGRGMDVWLQSQAVRIEMDQANNARIVDTEWRDLRNGQILSRLEYLAVTPPPDAAPDWDATTFEPIPIGVPGSRAGDYALVEVLLLGGIGVALLAGTLRVVERRTPY